jgi:small GTP-binding protein
MLSRILNKEQQKLLAAERQTLSALQVALSRFDTSEADLEVLRNSILQLDELFLIVIVGEFNAGKSAFINALLGQKLVEEGVTPTTTKIHLIQHGPKLEHASTGAVSTLAAPLPLLEEVNFVDTPGTNAISREHEAITLDFIPRSDLVLFVTSADRPFTESERAFMEKIKNWGKKIVVVVNKVDILRDPQESEQIERFVAESVEETLGFKPVLFTVAARDTLQAKLGESAQRLPMNRFADLESYIVSTLDQRERVRLKLLNPVGVGLRLVSKYQGVIHSRLELLTEDRSTIASVEKRLSSYKQEMAREFRYRLADVDNILHDFENRGTAFFDEYIRIGRFVDLLNKQRVKAEFEREVVADMPQLVEKRVMEIIDWMVTSDHRLWQSVVEDLRRRRSEQADRVIGQVGDDFQVSRNRLLETVGQSAQRAARAFDKEAEASRMAEGAQLAVAGTALAEVGAVGLGALVTMAATSAAADVTGIMAAGVLAVVGLFVLPSKRQHAKKDLRQKIAGLREKLMKGLEGQFDREIDRTLQRIRDSIDPYTTFVAGEGERFERLAGELETVEAELTGLKEGIEAAG